MSTSGSSSSTTSVAPANATHPFSLLNEFVQHHRIASVTHHDLGQNGNLWLAQVVVVCLDGYVVAAVGAATTKAGAKREAAEKVLMEYSGLPRFIASAPTALSAKKASAVEERTHLLEDNVDLAMKLGRQVFSRAPSTSPFVLISIDVEADENNKNTLLEVGLSWARSDNIHKVSARHMIIEEHLNVANGSFVPDNKGAFDFGTSDLVSLHDLEGHVTATIADASEGLECVLVGHSVLNDVNWLKSRGIELGELMGVLDIGLAYQGLQGFGSVMGLENMLKLEDLPYDHLHNAANDSFYTLKLALVIIDYARFR